MGQQDGASLTMVLMRQAEMLQWLQGVPGRPVSGASWALLSAASQLLAQCCRV